MSANSSDKTMITGNTTKEFIRFVIPSILGLIAISSAGIVDGLFVGNYVGSTALAAVNLILPIFYLFFGVCVMIVVGGTVIAGKALGENDAKEASNIFTKSFIVVVAYALICNFFIFIFAENIAIALGAKNDTLPLAITYLRTISPFMLFMGINYSLANFTRVDGAPNFALMSLVSIAVSNMALDYFLIKAFGLGIYGAALASGLAYALGSIILLTRYLIKKQGICFIKPFGSWGGLREACYNGFSEFINEVSGGLVLFVFNWILMLEAGASGVAAFTIVNYLLWLSIMIGYGNAEALSSLISVNFGARKPERIMQFIAKGVSLSAVVGCLLAAVLLFFPQNMVGLFIQEGDVNTTKMALMIVAIIWPTFLFNGINISLTGYFTGIHAAKQSAMIAMSRSLILPVILAVVLWKLIGIKGVFFALPVAEILTFCLSLTLYYRTRPDLVIAQDELKLAV